jgi:hypothetical protein
MYNQRTHQRAQSLIATEIDMRGRYHELLATVLICMSSPVLASSPEHDRADGFYNTGSYQEAYEVYLGVVQAETDNEVARYMAAQCAYLLDKNQEAYDLWLTVEESIGDDDLPLKEKLIQACERLDKVDEVQTRIADLARLRMEGDDESYKTKSKFCRDQFKVGKETFYAYHHFDFPDGDDTCFTIYSVGQDGAALYSFKFWCSEVTNEVARSVGTLKVGERLHHIDEYQGKQHLTHLHTKQEFSYREFKERVVEILNDRPRRKP